MSADTPEPDDPYNLIPDDFPYPSLEAAAADLSNTDPQDRKRCPARGCASIQITPHSSKATAQSETDWKCTQCGHQHDTPLPPARGHPEHDVCESRQRVESLSGAGLYYCHACEERFQTLGRFWDGDGR